MRTDLREIKMMIANQLQIKKGMDFSMIIINKKRIQIIVACLMIAIFAFSFQIAGNSVKEEQQNVIQTTATPVSGRTVVIDAGHRQSR